MRGDRGVVVGGVDMQLVKEREREIEKNSNNGGHKNLRKDNRNHHSNSKLKRH